jgi:BirA family transcriptional regulator, biotin operon repressor / biotin---[acetyl-CoA-carboxylase] ligase
VLEKSLQVCPNLEYFEQIESTNSYLLTRDLGALEDFSAVVAAEQTAGQGRLGRQWVSEPGSSISLSLLLKPKASVQQLSWLTLVAAVSVRHALTELGIAEVSIKWPNDVLVAHKKISGILAQLNGENLILGLGINLEPQQGAPEWATSISESGVTSSFDEVLAAVLTQLRARYLRFLADPNWAIETTRNEFLEHSSTIGSEVRAILPNGEEIRGKAIDIDFQGNLLIDSGKVTPVSAADIVHLRN